MMDKIKGIILGLALGCFCVAIIEGCGDAEKKPGPSEMYSVQENGQQVFYDETQKAYGDIFLGMQQRTVDTLLSHTEIRGTVYQMIPEYSTDGKLNSLFLRSDTIDLDNREKVARELTTVLQYKYGEPIYEPISHSTQLGLPNRSQVEGCEVKWGAHWREGNKYLVLGVEDHEEKHEHTDDYGDFKGTIRVKSVLGTSNIWLWIFNEDVWNNQGGAKAQEDVLNF